LITNFNNSNTNITNSLNSGATLLGNLINVDGNSGNGMLPISYNNPISITSTFPSILGSYNTNGLIYDYYTIIKNIIASIESLANNSNDYLDSSTIISAAITSSMSSITSLIDQLSSIDNYSWGAKSLNSLNNSISYIQLFYGIMIGICIMVLFGALLILLCDKGGCRYIMYIFCFFMLLIGLIGFLITTLISVSIPLVSWTCDYMKVAMSDKDNFYCIYYIN